jgi:hypothetical protein
VQLLPFLLITFCMSLMMTMTNPITPPPELLDQWCMDSTLTNWRDVATQAAQWGAEQELEACCTAIDEVPGGWADSRHLRHVRRPKPPSLKAQALKALTAIEGDFNTVGDRADTIRRALEALDD